MIAQKKKLMKQLFENEKDLHERTIWEGVHFRDTACLKDTIKLIKTLKRSSSKHISTK